MAGPEEIEVIRTNYQKEIAKALLDIGAVSFEEKPRKLKSGMLSPVYTDNRMLTSNIEQWNIVLEGFISTISDNKIEFDVMAGVEAGGISHSSVLGNQLSKSSVFVRKKAKGHGNKKMVEGGNVNGKKVLLIEDLVTTGGSSLKGVEFLRNEGATVTDCLVIVNYGFPETAESFKKAGVELHELVPFNVILDEAVERGLLNSNKRKEVESWLADPQKWTKEHKNN